MASAIKCNTSFISQVLKGSLHFSLEQAVRLADYLELDSAGTQYLLLLIQIERAGTRELKQCLLDQRKNTLASRKLLKNRIPLNNILSKEAESIYYNSWHYGAIHMALSLPWLRLGMSTYIHCD